MTLKLYHAARIPFYGVVFNTLELPVWAVMFCLTKGECIMAWSLAQIAMVLFFLWYGLSAFIPALKSDMFMKIGAVLALLIAFFILISK